MDIEDPVSSVTWLPSPLTTPMHNNSRHQITPLAYNQRDQHPEQPNLVVMLPAQDSRPNLAIPLRNAGHPRVYPLGPQTNLFFSATPTIGITLAGLMCGFEQPHDSRQGSTRNMGIIRKLQGGCGLSAPSFGFIFQDFGMFQSSAPFMILGDDMREKRF